MNTQLAMALYVRVRTDGTRDSLLYALPCGGSWQIKDLIVELSVDADAQLGETREGKQIRAWIHETTDADMRVCVQDRLSDAVLWVGTHAADEIPLSILARLDVVVSFTRADACRTSHACAMAQTTRRFARMRIY